MRRIGVLVLVVLFAITGCGGGSSTPKAEPTGSTSNPVTSPSPTTATVAQYASVIAQREAGIRRDYERIRSCAIFISSATTCGLATVTVRADMFVLVNELTGKSRQTGTSFLGAPPAEVAALAATTVADARAANREAGKLHRPLTPNKMVPLDIALETLTNDLSGWKPYGA